MSFFSEVYQNLSKVQFNDSDIDKKQGMAYVKWSKAWSELMKHYPDSTWEAGETTYYPDRTASVSVSVTIKGGTTESATRSMMLPVLNGNKPLIEPNAFQFNTSHMRCMVKCLALFGLGLYIYEGEEMPDFGADTESVLDTYVNLATEEQQSKFWKACGQIDPSERDLSKVPETKLRPALKWIKEQVAA